MESLYLQQLEAAMLKQGASESDIRLCRDYAARLLERGLPVLFDKAQIGQALQLHKIGPQKYHVFSISSGTKIRRITAPSRPLKLRQKWVLTEILLHLKISPHAHGFEAGRSIRTNALPHAEHSYALCVDIQDYFPSISQDSVFKVFREAGYSRSAAEALADVCCFDRVLPQGAPTSPRLSNLVFRDLDEGLAALAADKNAVYTRYADDLTFSADCDLGDLKDDVASLLQRHGFSLHPEKCHLYGPGRPKVITGLIVQNGTVRVPKAFKRTLRQEIYYCKKFGVQIHLENTNSSRAVNYREHLYGKAYYLHMIEPELGERCLRELDQIPWPSYYYDP